MNSTSPPPLSDPPRPRVLGSGRLVPMTLDEAWQIADRVPLNCTWQQKRVGAAGQWNAVWREKGDGARTVRHVGTEEARADVERAHAMIRAEIARIEELALPHLEKLIEIQARAFTTMRVARSNVRVAFVDEATLNRGGRAPMRHPQGPVIEIEKEPPAARRRNLSRRAK